MLSLNTICLDLIDQKQSKSAATDFIHFSNGKYYIEMFKT